MRKIGLLFVAIFAILIVPFSVLADNSVENNNTSNEENVQNSNEDTKKNEKVKVYFFHGDGCPHCAEARNFFDSIEGEYGELFELVSYETWKNANNAAILEQIADIRSENIEGVPYILIGNKSWPGYMSSFDEGIINAIKAEYDTPVDDRYDIMDLVDFKDSKENESKDYSGDVITLLVILIVAAGVVTGVIFARKKTS